MSRITFGTNIPSLVALRGQRLANAELSRSLERLSSGLRINRASDDPGGLALASRLNVDQQVHGRAIQNVNEGISYLSVAEEALKELDTLLGRMQELSTQAANGAISSTQRQALDDEAQVLVGEYNRVLSAAEHNNTQVLAPENQELLIQAGYGAVSSIRVELGGESTTTTVTGDGTFQARTTYGTGSAPRGVAVGDFNGDGVLDLVNADENTDTLSVHLGNGDGTFQARTTYGTGNNPREVAVGDFNGDGVLDLVNSDNGFDTLSVHLGNGDGTFQARTAYGAGNGPIGVAVGDFNGDGVLDLVNTDSLSITLSVRLGNGDGTFQARTTYGTGSFPVGIAVGDFNGDGVLDLVNADYSPETLSVHLGNGDGTFQARTTYDTGLDPYQVAVGDFNGDGKLDLVNTDNFSNTLSLHLGNGDGTFQARTAYGTGNEPIDVAVGDLDGDGVLDLVNSDRNSDTLSVHLGNANETTTTITISLTPISGISLATQSAAQSAQDDIDGYLDDVAIVNGLVGASLSRFSVTLSELTSRRQAQRDAVNRIMDADIAEEAAKFAAARIRRDTATSILAQATQQPQLVLKLFRQLSTE